MKHGPRIACLVIGVVFVGSLIVSSTSRPVRAQQGGDPLDLFAKIYPVFMHPRCINCHGVVQSNPGVIRSVTAETHPGGFVGDPDEPNAAVACDDCHHTPKAAGDVWEFTAPQSMWWIGKSVEELCVLQSAQVRNFNRAAGGASPTTPHSYLNHLNTDPLITQAFLGLAGGQRLVADPPPLKREVFLAAAKAWVDAGAPCRATGSITQVEIFSSHYTYPYPVGDGKTLVRESAKRDVHITRYPDGTAKAQVVVGGSQKLVTTYQAGCLVTMTSTGDWINLNQQSVPAEVKLDLQEGRYDIRFAVPADKTRQKSSGRSVSDCGLPPMSSDNSVDVTWQPWNFTIRCPATFPQDGKNTIFCNPLEPRESSIASGEMTRTIINVSRSAEPQSWLRRSPTGISRGDTGDPLPITVKTTWFLNLK